MHCSGRLYTIGLFGTEYGLSWCMGYDFNPMLVNWDAILPVAEVLIFFFFGLMFVWLAKHNKCVDCTKCVLVRSCLRIPNHKPACPICYLLAVCCKITATAIAFNWALDVQSYWWLAWSLAGFYYVMLYYSKIQYIWHHKF